MNFLQLSSYLHIITRALFTFMCYSAGPASSHVCPTSYVCSYVRSNLILPSSTSVFTSGTNMITFIMSDITMCNHRLLFVSASRNTQGDLFINLTEHYKQSRWYFQHTSCLWVIYDGFICQYSILWMVLSATCTLVRSIRGRDVLSMQH